jgi:hypothetical protein
MELLGSTEFILPASLDPIIWKPQCAFFTIPLLLIAIDISVAEKG